MTADVKRHLNGGTMSERSFLYAALILMRPGPNPRRVNPAGCGIKGRADLFQGAHEDGDSASRRSLDK